MHDHPRVIFRVADNAWLEAIVRYLVAPHEACRVKVDFSKNFSRPLMQHPTK